ncbi:histidine kinase [Nocardiopsis sp. CNT-189]|uniref:septum site-determining protein Ssd n=1 Tax=Nocardiopsis oceanisediminis TaxID=2816862 RepID=UPI003B363D6B
MNDASPARPLIATADPDLLDDLLRLAAAASVEVSVADSAALAGRDWGRAPLAVVGGDLLAGLAGLEPDRHPNAVVALRGEPDGAGPPAEADALRIGARALLRLPEDEERLAGLLADSAQHRAGPCTVLAVLGGRGGAGASVLSVALALAGVRAGLRTALLDADPLGGGLDLLCGGDSLGGTRWDALVPREGRMSWDALRGVLPSVRGCPLVTWPRGPAAEVPPAALRAVLGAAALGCDLVVLDLPRSLGPCAEEALRRCTAALLVVPADFLAVMAAYRAVPALRALAASPFLVTRGADASLPGAAVASALGLPLLGDVPDDPRLVRALDRGDLPGARPPSVLARAADRLLAAARSGEGARC